MKGCVRAKFDLGSSPSGPHLAALSFTCEGTTCSGVGLELLGSGYRMSLVKQRIVTGEFCQFLLKKCFSRPYLSKGRAVGLVVIRRHLSVYPSATDVPWLTGRS